MFQRRKLINSISIAASCAIAAISWSPARAATVIVSYQDSYTVGRGAAFSSGASSPRILSSDTQLNLPRFDPTLGTLRSVDLSARLYVQGNLLTHCDFAVYCYSKASGRVSDNLNLNYASNQLGIDLGPELEIIHSMSVSCEDYGIEASCFDREAASGYFEWRDFSFTGSEVSPFVGFNPFIFQPDPEARLRISGGHEGLPNDSVSQAYAGESDALAILYVVGLVRKQMSEDPLHTDFFSHAHLEGYSSKSVHVRYEYEPFAAVPEPATWAMMIAGFGLIGGVVRRKGLGAAFA